MFHVHLLSSFRKRPETTQNGLLKAKSREICISSTTQFILRKITEVGKYTLTVYHDSRAQHAINVDCRYQNISLPYPPCLVKNEMFINFLSSCLYHLLKSLMKIVRLLASKRPGRQSSLLSPEFASRQGFLSSSGAKTQGTHLKIRILLV